MVVVGAGLTGLWSAYYLQRADPGLRIAVLEQEVAGFGASGRNGGWCSALFPTSWSTLAKRGGTEGALRQHRAMQETVREVGRVAEAEEIDAHYRRGGTVVLAHTPVQLARMVEEVATARTRGFTEDDLRLLSPAEAREQLATDDAPRRDVHASLRRDPSRPAGPWTGTGRRALRCQRLRAHPGPGHRARRGAHRRR